MITYVKPSIVECGTSESVIKGQCGWGKENLTLDQKGTKKNKTLYRKIDESCRGNMGICTYCRRLTNQCNLDDNEC